ncbi:MAG: hypothetical protein KKA05_02320 [Alphaproteobacteria bacterium]|nr:hypothetical protein [Alphaproteobacteria bacterium]MBU0860134.1 hypothetical protein [Alphaproteobacteria bacterium]
MRTGLLALILMLLMSPVAHAQTGDTTPEATPETCGGGCLPGQTLVVDTGVPDGFDNCTEAYSYFTALHYEYILLVMIQHATLFTPDYVAACRKHASGAMMGKDDIVARNTSLVVAEAAAIKPVMTEIINNVIPAFVPAHCRTNQPARAESLGHFTDWIKLAHDNYAPATADYIATADAHSIECRHLTNATPARIHDIDFKDDILLGIAAGYLHMLKKSSDEIKQAFITYKQIRDKQRTTKAE